MDNNLMTAAEAYKMSANATNIKMIANQIQDSINIGATETSFYHIPLNDIAKLKELGYQVHETNLQTTPYIVSWNIEVPPRTVGINHIFLDYNENNITDEQYREIGRILEQSKYE